MDLYRVTPAAYLQNYSGKGASYQDGARWNLPGDPVLYFSDSPAVVLLEMANYLPSPRLIPKSYRLGVYELPDSISREVLPLVHLPSDWDSFPYPASTQALGSEWLKSRRSLLLCVPSVSVPEGLARILVLNPLHPEIEHLRLNKAIDRLYNPRAFTATTGA